MSRSYNPRHRLDDINGLGCSPFARHYWGNHCLFSFPAGTKMFQFPALALQLGKITVSSDGWVVPFGNLRIKVICTSPKLIAAYHVLHRLREPRHPPCALSYFLYDCILRYSFPNNGIIYTFSCFLLKLSHLRFDLCSRSNLRFLRFDGVENNGFEPLTLCVQSRCSSQLS